MCLGVFYTARAQTRFSIITYKSRVRACRIRSGNGRTVTIDHGRHACVYIVISVYTSVVQLERGCKDFRGTWWTCMVYEWNTHKSKTRNLSVFATMCFLFFYLHVNTSSRVGVLGWRSSANRTVLYLTSSSIFQQFFWSRKQRENCEKKHLLLSHWLRYILFVRDLMDFDGNGRVSSFRRKSLW